MQKNQKFKQHFLTFTLAMVLGLGSFVWPSLLPAQGADDPADEIEDDINDLQKKLKKAQEKQDALARELTTINSSLSSTQKTIAQAKIKIQQSELTIERKQDEIKLLEQQANQNRLILTGLIQDLYYDTGTTLPKVLLASNDWSRYIDHPDDLMTIQERITSLLTDLKSNQRETETEKSTLEVIKAEHEDLLEDKVVEQQALAAEQQDTVSDLEDQQTIVKRLQKELSELQSDLAKLTGKSYNAKDIREAVEFASDKTGVPEGVLYGFLKMETNLGANTGQCTYKKVKEDALSLYYNKNKKKYANSIALLEKRYNLFLDLVEDLDYSKDKKVSCTPRSYVGQGGAMGVPQFMSDTWRGYESQIRSVTGHTTPDPWNLTDGVTAMALKLKKAGATSSSASVIRKASINYLGAFNSGYYNGIVYWSKNYKLLFT